ncbi:MAG TPA: hypothetical protein VLW50_19040 [Streptosporangiaceae bacterium]|nr:hypothetical protein [Streptosporangiaceae bacterium]
MIEIMSFRLVAGADEAAFIAADRKVQTEFAYQQAGLLRRTTARSDDGGWIVIDLWRSQRDADARDERWGHDQVTAEFISFIDAATVRTDRYATLD